MFDFCVCECISVVWISGIALPFFVNACLLLYFFVLLLVYVFIFVFCSVCLSGTVSRPTSRGSFVASRPVHCWPVARPTLISFFFFIFRCFSCGFSYWLLLLLFLLSILLTYRRASPFFFNSPCVFWIMLLLLLFLWLLLSLPLLMLFYIKPPKSINAASVSQV